METNRERLQRLGITDIDSLMDESDGERCEICNKYITKNLSPQNPACEGMWCEDALEYWLDENIKEGGLNG